LHIFPFALAQHESKHGLSTHFEIEPLSSIGRNSIALDDLAESTIGCAMGPGVDV
jgi:hypothetical protein